MHDLTEKLLRACARAEWKNTSGPVADAVNEWQEAGCPDMPQPEEPSQVFKELADDLEKLAMDVDRNDMSFDAMNEKFKGLISNAKWRLRDATTKEVTETWYIDRGKQGPACDDTHELECSNCGQTSYQRHFTKACPECEWEGLR